MISEFSFFTFRSIFILAGYCSQSNAAADDHTKTMLFEDQQLWHMHGLRSRNSMHGAARSFLGGECEI